MAGPSDSTQTTSSTSTTAPTNPQVTATTNNLLTKLDTATNAGVPVFNQSLYVPNGATTQQGQGMALSAASNPDFASGIGGAIKSLGNAAAGNDMGQGDAAYATLRAKAGNDALTSVNSVFNNSGRFGGGTNAKAAGEGVTNALAGLDVNQLQNDRNWQAQAAGLLPGLFSASQLPSGIYGAVGNAQDADANAQRQAANDLYQRVNGAPWDTLGRASSVLNGTTANTPQTTQQINTTPSTPWYQTAIAGGLGLGSLLLG